MSKYIIIEIKISLCLYENAILTNFETTLEELINQN